MRAIVGFVLSVGAGIAGAYGIVNLTRLGDCSGACPDHIGYVPFLMAGILGVMAAGVAWRYAMAVAPVAGLAAAAILLSADGVDLVGDNLGFTVFIAVCVLAGPLILVAIALVSSGKRRQAQALARDGLQAVAVVESVNHTGVQINNKPQLAISYQIHPLDGSPPFPYR